MKNSSILVLLSTVLVLSLGFNTVLFYKIIQLNNRFNRTQSYVSDSELKNMQREIEQLSTQQYIKGFPENIQYDLKTKKPINSF